MKYNLHIFIILSLLLYIIDFSYSKDININKFNNIEDYIAIAEKTKNSSMYYNIGIYFLNNTNYGLGLYYIKKSTLLEYNSKHIKTLNQLRNELNIPSYYYEISPIGKILLAPFLYFSLFTLFLISFIFLLTGIILLYLKLFSKLKTFNNNKYYLLIITFYIIGTLYLIAGIIKFNLAFNKNEGIIIYESNLYEKANTNSNIIKKLNAGIEVTIKDEYNGFYKIKSIIGDSGHIETNNIKKMW